MTAFSVFLRTTRMSRHHFTTLLRILRHRHFKSSDLPKSYVHAKSAISNLPTLPLHKRSLAINNRRGSGRSVQGTATVYTHSISDILCRALSSPSLATRMYFRPAVKVHRPKEFWHGAMWMESSLFGVDVLTVEGGLNTGIF